MPFLAALAPLLASAGTSAAGGIGAGAASFGLSKLFGGKKSSGPDLQRMQVLQTAGRLQEAVGNVKNKILLIVGGVVLLIVAVVFVLMRKS